MKQPPRKPGRRSDSAPRRPKPAPRAESDESDGPEDPATLRTRRFDGNRLGLLIPITALDRKEDLDEVKVMIAAGEHEIARDELLYLVSDCRGFLEAHNLLGELALEENDLSLAQGHFGFAYEIGINSLPPGFKGRLPANREYNGAFYLAGRGTARCLIARGQRQKGREVLEQLARLDPQEPTIRAMLAELQERETVEMNTVSLPLVCDLSRAELAAWCVAQGEQTFRADQIRKWIFGKRVNDFDAMTDVPAPLRKKLAENFSLFSSQIAAHQVSKDGTEKLLLELADGERIECVLMREDDRRTICLSTQVGCGMGCVFCASGLLGLTRSLTAGEILEQVLRLDRLLSPLERITNVVVMGMGEPLANLPNLLKALAALEDKGGLGMSTRRVTISTVGLPEKIRELAQTGKSYNLAISLHAPENALRNQLVPVNDKIGVEAILAAADEFFEITGRRVTYEYVVLRERNDSPDQARQLAKLLAGRNAHVNLIPMNAVTELPFDDPGAERLRQFVEILEQSGLVATIRKRKGADIDAACGQLRLRHDESRSF